VASAARASANPKSAPRIPAIHRFLRFHRSLKLYIRA
jgi:hypothetical protein